MRRRRAVRHQIEEAGQDQVLTIERRQVGLVLEHRTIDGDIEVCLRELWIRQVLDQRLRRIGIVASAPESLGTFGPIGEMMPCGPPGSGEYAVASKSSGSSLLAAIATEPVLAMNAACPDRYAWLSPAPSQVVLPGGNNP